MQRAIVTPAVLSATALAELKDWLAITTTREDAALLDLLRSALDTCQGFTGQVPLATTYEEVHRLSGDWQTLGLGPVSAITGLATIAADGTRQPLAADQYLFDLTPHSAGRFRLLAATTAGRVAATYTAGIAGDWAALPAGLRHGLLRLAAHHFRSRETGADSAVPPTVVAALWQPWRRMRLA